MGRQGGNKISFLVAVGLVALAFTAACNREPQPIDPQSPKQAPAVPPVADSPPAPPPESLKAARQKTPLEVGPSDFKPSDEFLPPRVKVYEAVNYPSKVGLLAAYKTRDPSDGKKHPCIVWAHGGFGGISPIDLFYQTAFNDQSPERFRRAGFVILFPSWRGENTNPGKFELFGGEVDDLVSAVDYAHKLSYVDPDRIYLIGYDSGGSLALLAAELGVSVRLVISLGGTPDLSGGIPQNPIDETTIHYAPFDFQDKRQIFLRSPVNFVADLKIPTWYIEGQFSADLWQQAHEMEVQAKKYNAPFQTAFVQMADHFAFQRPAKRLLVEKLQADTGKAISFSLTKTEANGIYQKQKLAKPQIVEKPFAEIDAHSAESLLKTFGDLEQRDLKVVGHKLPHFLRIYRSPDDKPMAQDDLDYDVDDVQCTVQGVPVVMDRETLADLNRVRIRIISGAGSFVMVSRIQDSKDPAHKP